MVDSSKSISPMARRDDVIRLWAADWEPNSEAKRFCDKLVALAAAHHRTNGVKL